MLLERTSTGSRPTTRQKATPGVAEDGGLDDLLSIDDLAAYTGIPKNTLYYWRARGLGPRGMKLGKYVRYRHRDVEAWLDESLEDDRRR